MPSIDRISLKAKLAFINTDIDKLKTLQLKTLEQFEDFRVFHCTERLVQKLVDGALDINAHILSVKFSAYAESGKQTFDLMGKHDVLDKNFVAQISGSVGLRNAIVHGYDTLDKKILLDAIDLFIEHYKTYSLEIENWIIKNA